MFLGVGSKDFKGVFLACLIKKIGLFKSFILEMTGKGQWFKIQWLRKSKALLNVYYMPEIMPDA